MLCSFFFFFFNDTATTEIYTLSLHDALPIYVMVQMDKSSGGKTIWRGFENRSDRKSTRLNSSHLVISYAVFCLKKKKKKEKDTVDTHNYEKCNHNTTCTTELWRSVTAQMRRQ